MNINIIGASEDEAKQIERYISTVMPHLQVDGASKPKRGKQTYKVGDLLTPQKYKVGAVMGRVFRITTLNSDGTVDFEETEFSADLDYPAGTQYKNINPSGWFKIEQFAKKIRAVVTEVTEVV